MKKTLTVLLLAAALCALAGCDNNEYTDGWKEVDRTWTLVATKTIGDRDYEKWTSTLPDGRTEVRYFYTVRGQLNGHIVPRNERPSF